MLNFAGHYDPAQLVMFKIEPVKFRDGVPALDAAHLSAAEIGGADVVLTCDDVLIRRARRLGLGLRF